MVMRAVVIAPLSSGSRRPPIGLWSSSVAQEASAGEAHLAAEVQTALVERLQAGDAGALETVYRQHHQVVRAFARRLLGNDELAEDLVHDVFLSAPAAFRRFRGEAAVRTFLIGLAANKAKHYVRAAVRRRRIVDALAGEVQLRSEEVPDKDHERRELADALQRALDRLPVEERVAIVLCEVEERTSREVALIVDAPEATVRTRVFRAKRKLRQMLGGEP
jgi:RNA polymerase sigma-70 factor (ECF subfamily)